MMLYQVHEYWQQKFDGLASVVIAGGSVRDALLDREPKDYDLFLLDTEFRPAVIGVIKRMVSEWPVVKTLEWHNSEPYLAVTVRWNGFDVQIMCTPCRTVDELLDTFDWNVCLFAFDGRLHTRTDLSDIAEGKPLRLQTVKFPLSTLRRGFRFSERFKMTLDRMTILDLCAQVIAKRGLPGPSGAAPDMPALAAVALPEDR